ncbi:MAG: S41 family peptidase [Patescibacteria group bacterium]|nr:S41 family peptidase [Patescibacteria group bacterium]
MLPDNKKIRLIISGLALIIVFSGGIVLGSHFSGGSRSGDVINKEVEQPVYLEKNADFRMFWQVWNMVKDKYYKQPVSETRLFYGALEGMVAALDNPYTVFFTPENAENFTKDLEGKFEGIGAEIGIRHDQLTVISPLPDSPAERAGLKIGDNILAIDALDTTGMSVEKAVSLIRGPAGTDVVLLIWREGAEEPFETRITRGAIDMVSVRWKMLPDGIAYIELMSFAEDTVDLFNRAVGDVTGAGAKGVILDLRGNSGGYLESAVDVASHWIGTQIITIERDSKGVETPFYGNNQGALADIPTVILMNQGTASGSEILAGALKDYGKATLVGKQSFGKGSVQEMENLKDGSAVKITVAEWLTPNHESFDEQGIVPDHEVELTDENYNNDEDPQMDKAMEIIKEVLVK